jgi:hypothetical protein
LAEYRKAMAELAALAIWDKEATHQASDVGATGLNDAIVRNANARVSLHEHVDEHRCWSHSVYSALFFSWRNHGADTAAVSDQTSKVPS